MSRHRTSAWSWRAVRLAMVPPTTFIFHACRPHEFSGRAQAAGSRKYNSAAWSHRHRHRESSVLWGRHAATFVVSSASVVACSFLPPIAGDVTRFVLSRLDTVLAKATSPVICGVVSPLLPALVFFELRKRCVLGGLHVCLQCAISLNSFVAAPLLFLHGLHASGVLISVFVHI